MNHKNAYATTSDGSKIVLLYVRYGVTNIGLIGFGFDETNSVFTIPSNSKRYWYPDNDKLHFTY